MAKTGLLLLAVAATFIASMLLLDSLKELQPTEYQKERMDETKCCIRTTIETWKSIGLTSPQRVVVRDLRLCIPLPIVLVIAFCFIRKNWDGQ